MIEYKTETKIIQDIEYDYVYCLKCEVWILEEKFNFETGEHVDCERYQKNKEIRKRAGEKALSGVRRGDNEEETQLTNESKIEVESKRRTLLAEELRWQMYEADRENNNYTWLDALNDTFDLASDNRNNKVKRQCLRLYKKLGFLRQVDISKVTVFATSGRASKTRVFHKIDGAYYSLER